MRVVEADVPAGIMPAKINASLIDIKIGGKRGPDDALYNKSQVMNAYILGTLVDEVTETKLIN